MQQAETATRNGDSRHIEPFEYPAGFGASSLPEWDEWVYAEAGAPQAHEASAQDAKATAIETRLRAEFGARLAEETRRSSEAGRAQGRQLEHEAQTGSRAAAEHERARQAAALIESFTAERDRYLQTVEHEVVKLALAVAARILRREAQMDPLLLAGAVRVALGQLSRSTQVRLLVPPAELDLWTEAIALVPNLAVKPTVIAGEGMRLGDCAIETELGSVDLGIRAQLGEIERGFFDRAGGPRTISSISGADDASGAGRERRS